MKKTLILSVTATSLLGALAVGCAGESESADSSSAANTSAVSCSPAQQIQAFQKMIKAPLVPPKSIGGIDFTVGNTWAGPTLDDAERTLCQSTPGADPGDQTTATAGWGIGDSHVVEVGYDKTTRKIDFFSLNPGYEGTLDFKSRPTSLTDPSKPNPFGQHTYSIGIEKQILRDGQPWEINWKKQCTEGVLDCFDKQSTEIFDAMMYTFAPELASTQGSCRAEQVCLASATASGMGLFGARPLGIYLFVGDNATQPAASSPMYMYGFYSKQMPFSGGELALNLGAEGSIVTAKKLGDRGSNCVMKVGQPFSSFLGDCVQVMNDPALNDALKRKAIGGARQVISSSGGSNRGTWLLDVAGARPNFASERFDETEPTSGALAREITLDIRSGGKVKNDFAADGVTMNFAGTGAVLGEYARLVQTFLHRHMNPSLPRFPLGAPECQGAAPALGCTGMEQIVLPTDAASATDPDLQVISAGPDMARRLGMRTILKPGDPRVVFCADRGTYELCGWNDAPNTGMNLTVLDTKKQVVAILGGGSEDALEEGPRDPKVYVRFFTQALVKHLLAAGQAPTEIADGDITIDLASDVYTVKYKNRFEYTMSATTGSIVQMTFR